MREWPSRPLCFVGHSLPGKWLAAIDRQRKWPKKLARRTFGLRPTVGSLITGKHTGNHYKIPRDFVGRPASWPCMLRMGPAAHIVGCMCPHTDRRSACVIAHRRRPYGRHMRLQEAPEVPRIMYATHTCDARVTHIYAHGGPKSAPVRP